MKKNVYFTSFLFSMLFYLSISPCFADFANFPELKSADDFIYSLFEKFQARLMAFTVSNQLQNDSWVMYPVELDFSMCEAEKIPDLLSELESFQDAGSTFRATSLNLSLSAESRPSDDKELVNGYLFIKLIKGPDTNNFPHSKMIEYIGGILEQIHFEPGINYKKGQVEGINTWLTNLRIDSDNRVQLTGYATSWQDLYATAKAILASGKLPGLLFTTLNTTVYSKIPVWRFDAIAGGLALDDKLVSAMLEALNALNNALAGESAPIVAIRTAPLVRSDNASEFPMELSFKGLTADKWESLKKRLSGYDGQGSSFKNFGELIEGAEGQSCQLKLVIPQASN